MRLRIDPEGESWETICLRCGFSQRATQGRVEGNLGGTTQGGGGEDADGDLRGEHLRSVSNQGCAVEIPDMAQKLNRAESEVLCVFDGHLKPFSCSCPVFPNSTEPVEVLTTSLGSTSGFRSS